MGKPQLLIYLYGPPTLHVKLKFVRPEELAASIQGSEMYREYECGFARIQEMLREAGLFIA